jgi:NAD(P)-dependent dehydrogenase (short-subunit alcohol dehydrogenase family)
MAQRLTGKSAVITGGGSPVGVGREVALALAAEGAKVVVNDIFRDYDGNSGADRVVEQIRKANGTAIANYDSVATMQGGENIIKTATSNFGSIDILVNCAGNVRHETLLEITEKQWDAVMDVHLKGHLSCCKAAAKEMVKQKSGRIINFTSRAAFPYGVGAAGLAYSVAKGAILSLTMALSSELKEYGITVNAVSPSAVTNLFPESRGRFGGGQMEGPHYVAPMVAYLAMDEAKNITGQCFYVSSGDICIFTRPMQLTGQHKFIRKIGKWTIDELSEIIPPLLELTP